MAGRIPGGFDLRCAAEFEAWVIRRREALTSTRQALLSSCARAEEEAGQLRAALALRQQLLRGDELAEPHHQEVMRLHALLGERGAALRQFARLRQVLADELALEPLPKTVALAQEILRGTPSPCFPRPFLRWWAANVNGPSWRWPGHRGRRLTCAASRASEKRG
ncbi:BTAD domain-containing putative transcriptional regulator [Deinococcus malanensis]|uniref:AfsR/SARP family transcriptional regulator n=1 Tax=Deinococcus malanensis TaxID=1706855 RepID=UPI003638218B